MSSPYDSVDAAGRLIADRPMSRVQVVAIAIAVALNALDGFDVLAITFALPGIARDWRIGPAELGVALSSGLAGMAIGSLALAPLGDRWGRRPLILLCLAVMATGMMLSATSRGLVELCLWRIVTGLGIGGMLAAINAVAAEFANERRRDLCVGLMTIGYPVGGLIGGFVVADLVIPYGWQVIFLFGGVVTAAFLPLIWFGIPESPSLLARRGTAESLKRANALLARMNHPPLPAGFAAAGEPKRTGGSTAALLRPGMRRTTLVLVAAYFLHILTFYFFSGWLPKLMSDLGYATPDAIRTSAMMSLGGVVGGTIFGWLAPRVGLVRLLAFAMLATSSGFAVFGLVTGLPAIQATAFVIGIAVFGGIVGLYALLARSFPPELRVTGTGLAIGLGRGGSIIGPVVGGALIAQGVNIATAVTIVGGSSALAALVLLIGRAPDEPAQ